MPSICATNHALEVLSDFYGFNDVFDKTFQYS